MIRKFFQLACDGPGCNDVQADMANDPGEAAKLAVRDGWYIKPGLEHFPTRHYCPECKHRELSSAARLRPAT